MARQGPDPGAGTARFGPVEGAPRGGAVLGGLLFTIGVDGSLVRPTLEESRAIAQQLAPSIQKLLNLELRVDTNPAAAQLRTFEAQAQTFQQRMQRVFSAPSGFTDSGRFIADATRQQQQAMDAATRQPLGLRGRLDLLPAPDTRAFRSAADEAVAALRGVETQGTRSLGTVGKFLTEVGEQGFGSFTRGAAAAAAALISFQAGEKVLRDVVSNSQDARQAQFELGQTFGTGAQEAQRFAESMTQNLGRSVAEIEHADAELQRVGQVVGLTRQQVLQLGVIASDIAAVTGRSQQQTGHAISAAFLGQPRGLDILGVPATQAVIKASGELEEAQRRNAGATELTIKSQALYNLILRETATYQGAAAQRAKDGVGAFDALDAGYKNYTASLGQGDTVLTSTLQNIAAHFQEQARVNRAYSEGKDALAAYFAELAKHVTDRPTADVPGGFAAGRFPAGRFPVGTPVADATQDATEAERFRASSTAQQVTIGNLVELANAQQFYNQSRQAAARITDPDVRGQARAEIDDKGNVRVTNQKDLADATQRLAEGERLATQEAKGFADAQERAAKLLGDQVDALGGAGDAFKRLAENQQSTADAAVKQNQAVQDSIKSALESAKPESRDALAARFREINPVATQQALDEIAQDPTAKIKDAQKAQTEADQAAEKAQRESEQRQKEVAAELAREAEQRTRHGEDAQVQGLRDAEKTALASIQGQADAERDRHDAAVRGLQDETEARQRVAQSQERQLDLDQRLADTGRGLADAQARLAQAQTGPGVPGDRSRTTGQRAQGIRDAQAAVDAASTQAALAALDAGGLGAEGVLTPQQRQQAIASLRAGLLSRTDLDPAASARASQLLYEASLPPGQVPAQDRAAIDQALRGQIGREQEKADRADRDAQRQEERLNRDNTKSLSDAAKDSREASDKQITAAERQNTAARDQRETAAAWARIFGPGTPGAAAAAASVNAIPPAPGAGGSSTAAGVSPGPPPAGTAYGAEGVTVVFNGPVSVGGKEGGEALAKQIVAGIQQARQQTGATA